MALESRVLQAARFNKLQKKSQRRKNSPQALKHENVFDDLTARLPPSLGRFERFQVYSFGADTVISSANSSIANAQCSIFNFQ